MEEMKGLVGEGITNWGWIKDNDLDYCVCT